MQLHLWPRLDRMRSRSWRRRHAAFLAYTSSIEISEVMRVIYIFIMFVNPAAHGRRCRLTLTVLPKPCSFSKRDLRPTLCVGCIRSLRAPLGHRPHLQLRQPHLAPCLCQPRLHRCQAHLHMRQAHHHLMQISAICSWQFLKTLNVLVSFVF